MDLAPSDHRSAVRDASCADVSKGMSRHPFSAVTQWGPIIVAASVLWLAAVNVAAAQANVPSEFPEITVAPQAPVANGQGVCERDGVAAGQDHRTAKLAADAVDEVVELAPFVVVACHSIAADIEVVLQRIERSARERNYDLIDAARTDERFFNAPNPGRQAGTPRIAAVTLATFDGAREAVRRMFRDTSAEKARD